jgi:hypothetical protein
MMDLDERHRQSRAKRDALVRKMRKRAMVPAVPVPPTAKDGATT